MHQITAKAAGYSAEHVVWPLGVNNDLPDLDRRYCNLKAEAASLEAKKQNLLGLIQDYSCQITALGKTLYNYCSRCEQEERKLAELRIKRMKEENITKRFQNNNAEIRKIIGEKVRIPLSNRRGLLNLVALCITKSIKENPEKYRHLIPQDKSPVIDYSILGFNPLYISGQSYLQPQHQQHNQSKVYFFEDYVAMLSEDGDKLMEKLVKELGDEILSDYAVGTSTLSLPLFPSSDMAGLSPNRRGDIP
jgi:hypothetical protein